MKIKSFKNFFHQYVQPDDRLIIYLIFVNFCLGLAAIIINSLTYQYPGNNYFPSPWILFTPPMLCLLIFSWFTHHITPRVAYFTKTYCLFFFIIACQSILVTGIQYTPFNTIDTFLVAADKSLGYDTNAVMNWTYAHIWFAKLMWASYNFWVLQLALIPLLFGLLFDKKAINLFYISFLISVLIGAIVYYLLPTAAPSSIFHNSHFDPQQLATSLKFYQIHHHIKPSTILGGMIAMPSFHVTCALLILYACKHRIWLFLLLLPINLLIILSTVCLGWHYLMDVIGAFLLAATSIIIFYAINNQLSRQNDH